MQQLTQPPSNQYIKVVDMVNKIKRSIVYISCFGCLAFGLYHAGRLVLAEQTGSTPDSASTSRIKTIYDSLVSLSHGSESAGAWGNWGVMWNRIRSAGEWVPSGDATEADVVTGKTFYKDSRTIKTGTKAAAETCIPFTVNHLASGGVAPIDKTVTYGVVKTSIGGTGEKCWITQNLGAYNQASSATDATEAAAGWYFQFNRKQGYKVADDGVTRTPSSAWIASIDENLDWQVANDPCTLELGVGWRIPTSTEWTNADGAPQNWNNYNDTYASVLKLHAAGYLSSSSGDIGYRGVRGGYWSSTQHDTTQSRYFYFASNNSFVLGTTKTYGFSVLCLKD